MSQVPVLEKMPENRNLAKLNTLRRKQKALEDFAAEVESKIRRSRGREALLDQVCRLIYSSDQRIAALMICKWVEWRYGKATEHVEHTGNHTINIVSYIPRPGSAAAQCSTPEVGNCDNAVITIAQAELTEPGEAAEPASDRPAESREHLRGNTPPGYAGGSK